MYSTSSQTSHHSLPVSPQVLEQNFLRFPVQDPPCVPQVQIENWMAGYVRLVAGMSAHVIQDHAQNNPARTFLFNLLARNSFDNEEFTLLVSGILDYLVFEQVRQPGIRVEMILDETVRNIIELLTAAMVKRYPALRGHLAYLGQQAAAQIDGHISEFEQMSNAVEQFRRQYGYLPCPPGEARFQRPVYDGMGAGAARMGGAGYGGSYPAPGREPMPAGISGRYDGVHAASAQLFNGGQQPVTPRSGEIYSSRFSNLSDTSVPRYARANGSTLQGNTTMNAVIEAKPALKDGPPEDINETTLMWSPSGDQPYHPIFNPDTSQLFYQRLASGAVFAVVRARGDDMDYDRHRTKSVFGPVAPAFDPGGGERIMHGLQQGLKEIREERQARDDGEAPGFSTRVREGVIEDSALEGVWLQGAVEWQVSAEGGRRPAVFRVYGDVYDIAVGDDDESDFIETLRNAGTFRNLRGLLDDGYGTVSESLWYKANDRATRLVNRVLTLNLGLHGTTIDSFTADLEALLQVLRQVHGEAMLEAFLRHQRAPIAAIYRETPESNRDYIGSVMYESLPKDCEKPKLTFMSSWSSLTFVNCISHELAVEWGKHTTALVTKHAVPVFYQIVRDIVEEARDLGHNLEQYLLQTLDGRIIEIGTALLADDEGYVARLIK